jgi:hypothetical protein
MGKIAMELIFKAKTVSASGVIPARLLPAELFPAIWVAVLTLIVVPRAAAGAASGALARDNMFLAPEARAFA